MGGSSSYEVEDEFHRAEEDRGEPPGDGDGDRDGDGDGDRDGDVPLELTKKSEEDPPPAPVPAEDSNEDSLHDAVSSSEPAQEVEVKTEEEARPSEAALHLNGAAHQAGAGPGEAAEAGVAGAEVAGVLQQQQEYGGQLGQLVYHNDGSYIEYSYEDGTKAAGEASVQVVKLSATFRDNFRNIWTKS